MTAPARTDVDNTEGPEDPVEAVTRQIPLVLPIVGALLIFLLALIAVSMA